MPRTRRFSDYHKEELSHRYEAGSTPQMLADEYCVSVSTIYKELKENGVTLRSQHKYQLDHGAFDVLTPAALYWAGFLFADGCISGRRQTLTLGLAHKDISHIEMFRDFLRTEHPIYVNRTNTKASLAICSKRITSRLYTLGMVNSNHSNRVAAPVLAQSPDFWRGMIDGDGWIARSYGEPAFLGLCGNADIIEQYCDFVRQCDPNMQPSIRKVTKTNKIVKVVLGIFDSKIMVGVLYANDQIALHRKKVLAMELAQRTTRDYRYGENPQSEVVSKRLRRSLVAAGLPLPEKPTLSDSPLAIYQREYMREYRKRKRNG